MEKIYAVVGGIVLGISISMFQKHIRVSEEDMQRYNVLATKIQALWRGCIVRKHIQSYKDFHKKLSLNNSDTEMIVALSEVPHLNKLKSVLRQYIRRRQILRNISTTKHQVEHYTSADENFNSSNIVDSLQYTKLSVRLISVQGVVHQSAYAVLRCGQYKYKTPTEKGRSVIHWNQSYQFYLEENTKTRTLQNLLIEVYHERSLRKDIQICSVQIQGKEWDGIMRNYPLLDSKGSYRGQITAIISKEIVLHPKQKITNTSSLSDTPLSPKEHLASNNSSVSVA